MKQSFPMVEINCAHCGRKCLRRRGAVVCSDRCSKLRSNIGWARRNPERRTAINREAGRRYRDRRRVEYLVETSADRVRGRVRRLLLRALEDLGRPGEPTDDAMRRALDTGVVAGLQEAVRLMSGPQLRPENEGGA